MSEALAAALAMDRLWFLALGAFLAGIVRGFAGFGTAMVYLPFAGSVLGPFEALTTLIIKDVTAPLMHIPRALREGHPPDVLRLGAGALIAVPVGVFVLTLVEREVFRWAVSLVALLLLALLVFGFRYRGPMTPKLVFTTGALGGFLSGAVGLPGPPVILLYMASTLPASAIRANLTLYLILADILMLVVFWLGDLLVFSAIALGVLMILPYFLGNWLGAVLFRPEYETLYRRVAYGLIAASAIMGLPIWEG